MNSQDSYVTKISERNSLDVTQDKFAPRNGQRGTTFSIYPQGTPNNPIVLIVIARSQR